MVDNNTNQVCEPFSAVLKDFETEFLDAVGCKKDSGTQFKLQTMRTSPAPGSRKPFLFRHLNFHAQQEKRIRLPMSIKRQ